MTPNQIAEVERLAWLDAPDWDNWCGNACGRVSVYLVAEGVGHRIESAGDDRAYDDAGPRWPWGSHTFIRLGDGTILDPTITQFVGEGATFLRGTPSTERTAVLPSAHPSARYYDRWAKS